MTAARSTESPGGAAVPRGPFACRQGDRKRCERTISRESAEDFGADMQSSTRVGEGRNGLAMTTRYSKATKISSDVVTPFLFPIRNMTPIERSGQGSFGVSMSNQELSVEHGLTIAEVDEMLRGQAASLTSFRHVLMLNGQKLFRSIVEAHTERVAVLGQSPRFDVDGSPFLGPSWYDDPQWFSDIWSADGNQSLAMAGCLESDETPIAIIPVYSYGAIMGAYKQFEIESGDFEHMIQWAVGVRRLVPWIAIPLEASRFNPILIISREPNAIERVVRSVISLSAQSLVSVWAGPELAKDQ